MARNKHPEETVNLILDVATRLFMEKGYEHTSIQDIIDNLGGLSKGAIYHHFKSKEDILVAVTDRMTEESNRVLESIRDRTDLTGREKLKTIFKESILRPVQNDRYIKESAANTVCGTLFYHFIIFRQDLASSSSVEQGAIWHREAMVRMLAI